MENKTILLVGGSGFIGNCLGVELVKAGYRINLLTRKIKPTGFLSFPVNQFKWDSSEEIPQEALDGVSHIINLAGESIGDGRWTKRKCQRIVESRVGITKKVVSAANRFHIDTLIQASAIGYYGDTKDQEIDEKSIVGKNFLAETAKQWEASMSHLDGRTRKVVMRLGVVLGASGGALLEILTPYNMGVGAIVGDGKQFFSWIHIDDLCRFVLGALENESYQGTYNLTAPSPVTYRQLHEALANHYHAFAWAKIPSLFFKIALGKKSELLLCSQRVIPKKLMEEGFGFHFPNLKSCLENLLTKNHKDCAVIERTQWVPYDLATVWNFFSTEKNLEKITPPFLNFKIERVSTPYLQNNSIIDYRLKIHGIPIRWRSKIVDFRPKTSFQDIQLKGPYRTWHHTHDFLNLAGGTLIRDKIRFKLPFGCVGSLLAFPFVKKDVGRIFDYRRQVVSKIFSNNAVSHD